MRNSLILIGAFGLSAFISEAIAATTCDQLGSVPLEHAVVTDARLVPEGPGQAPITPGASVSVESIGLSISQFGRPAMRSNGASRTVGARLSRHCSPAAATARIMQS